MKHRDDRKQMKMIYLVRIHLLLTNNINVEVCAQFRMNLVCRAEERN